MYVPFLFGYKRGFFLVESTQKICKSVACKSTNSDLSDGVATISNCRIIKVHIKVPLDTSATLAQISA